MKTTYLETIFCKELNTNIKTFISAENISNLKKGATSFTIPSGMEYRPDKIAAYLYNNERMGWVIDLANGFTNGVKEYTLYRNILVPTQDAIDSLKTEE